MSCENCTNRCYCAIGAADGTVAVTGNGGSQTPYSIGAVISTQVGNALIRGADGGLYANQQAGLPTSSGTTTGYTYYDTTTAQLLTVAGPTDGARAPWNLPWGMLAYASTGADQTGISAETSLTGLSVTVSLPANRRIRVTGHVRIAGTTVGDLVVGNIKEGGTVLQHYAEFDITKATYAHQNEASAVLTPTVGSHTYNLTLQRVGSGTVSSTCDPTYPNWIMVEDIGPSGLPA